MRIAFAPDPSALLAQAKAAGIPITSLWATDDEIGTHDAHGNAIDIPAPIRSAMQTVINNYVPPPPIPQPDYGNDAADITLQLADVAAMLRAFIAKTPPTNADVVANAKLQNRVLLAILQRIAR